MPAIPESMQRERYADECAAAGVLPEYEALLAAGNPPGFAAMLALQSPPGSKNTDRAFTEGARRQMESMSPKIREMVVGMAQKAGINTEGKFYKGSLGRCDNPAAWVSSAQDVIESCKKQNLNVSGVVNYTSGTPQEKQVKSVPLAPDLVREMEVKTLQANPALAEKCRKSKKARGELREKVISTYGRKNNKFA